MSREGAFRRLDRCSTNRPCERVVDTPHAMVVQAFRGRAQSRILPVDMRAMVMQNPGQVLGLVDVSLFLRMISLIGLLLLGLISTAHAQQAAPGSQVGGGPNRLLIVTPQAWISTLDEFVGYKRTLLPADLRSLEDILQNSSGADEPEKLKRFLYAQWRERGLGYVLLVGDVDVMPVRYMVLDRITPAAFDYAFYPSDLYYADLAKTDGTFEDWNAERDGFHAGYYGEVRGEKNKQDPINFDRVDYRPEIAVGRWPVSTVEEVALVAAKTVRYEKAVVANKDEHMRRAAFLAVSGWVDSRTLLDQCAARLTNAWQIQKRYSSNGGARPGMLPPSPEQVRGLFNEGVGLVVHTGHGQPDAWEQCFSVADLDHLTNATRLPVVMSVGCSTAYFAPLAPYGQYVDVGRQGARGDRLRREVSGATAAAGSVSARAIQSDGPGRADAQAQPERCRGLHWLQHGKPTVRTDPGRWFRAGAGGSPGTAPGRLLGCGCPVLFRGRAPRVTEAKRRLVSAEHLLPGDEIHGVR